jgi:hypothetical protein
MKLFHFALYALTLIPMSFSVVSAIDTAPANASEQTDRQWEEYFSSRKIVRFSNYSSGFGSGSRMSSSSAFHFCKNGNYVSSAQSAMAISAGNMSVNSNDKSAYNGSWRVIKSIPQAVIIEFIDSDGEKRFTFYKMGSDKRLYNKSGDKLLTGPSGVC